MEVPAHLANQFVEFLRIRYGADMREHSEETRIKIKEFGRGFVLGDFVCLKYYVPTSINGDAIIQVVCSNSDRVGKINSDWSLFVTDALKNTTESPEKNES